MPHLHLKISQNLDNFPFNEFAHDAHEILREYANIEKCKSKLDVVETFYVGSDPVNKGFVYLEILLMPRPEDILKIIGQKLFDLLNHYATPMIKARGLSADVNVEIRILQYYWQP